MKMSKQSTFPYIYNALNGRLRRKLKSISALVVSRERPGQVVKEVQHATEALFVLFMQSLAVGEIP